MIVLPALKAIPWRLIGYGLALGAFVLLFWRINVWHTAYGELRSTQERLEAEQGCEPGSMCAARVAAAEVAQAARNQEAVAGYEKEIADLRNRPVPTRVIRVCRQGSPGDLRDAPATEGTDAASPGAGVVQSADEFDTGPLRDLAREADEVSARLRALQGWAQPK